jgi:hypothetical protein
MVQHQQHHHQECHSDNDPIHSSSKFYHDHIHSSPSSLEQPLNIMIIRKNYGREQSNTHQNVSTMNLSHNSPYTKAQRIPSSPSVTHRSYSIILPSRISISTEATPSSGTVSLSTVLPKTKSVEEVTISLQKQSKKRVPARDPTARTVKRRVGPCDRWSKEEDRKLVEAYLRYNGMTWNLIASSVGTKTASQCNQHWYRVLNPSISKAPWSKSEDQLLTDLVEKHGTSSWKKVSDAVKGRTDIQCRHRWYQMNKSTNKNSITGEPRLSSLLIEKSTSQTDKVYETIEVSSEEDDQPPSYSSLMTNHIAQPPSSNDTPYSFPSNFIPRQLSQDVHRSLIHTLPPTAKFIPYT